MFWKFLINFLGLPLEEIPDNAKNECTENKDQNNGRYKELRKDQTGSCKNIQKQHIKLNFKEISKKKIDIKKISPRCVSNKNSARNSEKASPINSPKNGCIQRKNPPTLPKDIDNIYKLLECLDKQFIGKNGESNSKENANITLKNLLRAELQKILNHEGQGGDIPKSKERKNSVANIHIGDNGSNSKEGIKITIKDKKLRHNTPSTDRLEQHKFAGKGSVSPTTGTRLHNRSSSREIAVAAGIKAEGAGHVKKGFKVVVPKNEGEFNEEPTVHIQDSISSEKEKLIAYTKDCIQYI